jgi:hypothetical protein
LTEIYEENITEKRTYYYSANTQDKTRHSIFKKSNLKIMKFQIPCWIRLTCFGGDDDDDGRCDGVIAVDATTLIVVSSKCCGPFFAASIVVAENDEDAPSSSVL